MQELTATTTSSLDASHKGEGRQARAHSPGMARLWHSIARWHPIKILLTQFLSIWLALGQDQLYFSMWLKHSDLSGCPTGFLQGYALGGWWVNTILMASTCACPLKATPLQQTQPFQNRETQAVPLVTALLYALSIKLVSVNNYFKFPQDVASIAIFRSRPNFNRRKKNKNKTLKLYFLTRPLGQKPAQTSNYCLWWKYVHARTQP